MPSAQRLPTAVLETLASGGTVICANARAARALGGLYGENKTAQGQSAWKTPRIIDWAQWLHAQWTQLLLTGRQQRTLLTSLQEEVLWNEVVRPTVESRSLIAAEDVARLAASAFALVLAYDASPQLQRGEWDHPTLEPELFRKWALEWMRRSERNRWLCEAQLPWAIAEALHGKVLAAPPSVLWNGFDRLTAADQRIRLVLDQLGCVQTDLAWDREASERLLAAPAAGEEIEACAAWARAQLARHPSQTIGILLPDLQSARPEVDRVFRRVLSPEHSGIGQQAPPYEFTLGVALADVPVIAAALALLQWCVDPCQQETITWIMTTGFFSRTDDAAILAEADLRVRKRLSAPEQAMDEALERISKFATPSGGNWAVANWVRRLRAALGLFEKAQGRARHCADWVATSVSILRAAGWPGDQAGSESIGFQISNRWQRALEEVSALSFSDRRYDFREFLKLLSSHLRHTIFSPESLGAPITISGIPESAGRSFDAVWVLGATDKALPAATRMHPLLPAWLQREKGMPGSSSEQDWQLTSAALARLRSSTFELHFSYAREGAEGAQRPSSLLADLVAEATETLPGKPTRPPAYPLDTFADTMLVPWSGGRAAGGHGVLKDQAACPFKAFAGRRLGAQELPAPELGLSPSERGSVAHNVLASLWADERMRTSDNLRSVIVSGQLDTLIQQHVSAEFERYDARASTDWERSYLQLELERVCALMEQWLQIESRRKPFAVEQVEEEATIVVAGLTLDVRMDRIDRVQGGRLLIDYKTGQISKDAWNGDRPTDPQLPIYATSGTVNELRDILFARVVNNEMKFFSAMYGSKPDLFPENPADPDAETRFEETRGQWTATLHALSRSFQEGIATVTPKEYPGTCEHCRYPALCRIAEAAPALAMSEEDEQ